MTESQSFLPRLVLPDLTASPRCHKPDDRQAGSLSARQTAALAARRERRLSSRRPASGLRQVHRCCGCRRMVGLHAQCALSAAVAQWVPLKPLLQLEAFGAEAEAQGEEQGYPCELALQARAVEVFGQVSKQNDGR